MSSASPDIVTPKTAKVAATSKPVALVRTPHYKATYSKSDWDRKRGTGQYAKKIKDMIEAYKIYNLTMTNAGLHQPMKDSTTILDALHYFADTTEAPTSRSDRSAPTASTENKTPTDSAKY